MSLATPALAELRSPLPLGLLAWMNERFPLRNAVFFAALYLACVLVGRAATPGGEVTLGLGDAIGFLAAYAFFLTLRVLDEHKDFEQDSFAHPGRVLQRGLVTLGHLKVVGIVAILLQIGVSASYGGWRGPVLGAWLFVAIWAALMTAEFFVAEWLRERLVLYAVSHMLVMPLFAFWIAQMGAGDGALSLQVAWLCAFAFVSGMTVEVARKTRGPEEERPGFDTYTGALGTDRVALVLVVLLFATLVIAGALLATVTGVRIALIGLLVGGLVSAPAWRVVARFPDQPNRGRAKRVELTIGLAVLAQYVIIIVALLLGGRAGS